MNRTRLFSAPIPSIVLKTALLAVLLAACAPAASPTPTGQPPSESSPAVAQAATALAATPALTASPLPLATSRGPELHATDPATVELASGGVQLVEFFRFT